MMLHAIIMDGPCMPWERMHDAQDKKATIHFHCRRQREFSGSKGADLSLWVHEG